MRINLCPNKDWRICQTISILIHFFIVRDLFELRQDVANLLTGGGGSMLSGGKGNDLLIGGGDHDVLIGGP